MLSWSFSSIFSWHLIRMFFTFSLLANTRRSRLVLTHEVIEIVIGRSIGRHEGLLLLLRGRNDGRRHGFNFMSIMIRRDFWRTGTFTGTGNIGMSIFVWGLEPPFLIINLEDDLIYFCEVSKSEEVFMRLWRFSFMAWISAFTFSAS